jgi:integrase/recombinase XerD
MTMSFEALLAEYLASLRAKRHSPGHVRGRHVALSRFLDHAIRQGVTDPREVKEAHVVSFVHRLRRAVSERTGRPLAASTRALVVSAVKGFFAFLERRQKLLVNPAQHVPAPRRFRLPRAIGQNAVRLLLDAPDPATPLGQRDRAILELIYGSGLRLSECVRLDLADLDLERGTLLIRNGKGKKDRYVPVAGRALLALRAYLREGRLSLTERHDDGALFVARYGKRLGPMSVRLLVKRSAAKAGVKATTHVLRHACATHLLAGGADVRHVQELLGHKDLATTALYTKVDTHGLAQLIRRCHPREKRKR